MRHLEIDLTDIAFGEFNGWRQRRPQYESLIRAIKNLPGEEGTGGLFSLAADSCLGMGEVRDLRYLWESVQRDRHEATLLPQAERRLAAAEQRLEGARKALTKVLSPVESEAAYAELAAAQNSLALIGREIDGPRHAASTVMTAEEAGLL